MNWRFSLFVLLMFGLLAGFSLAPWPAVLCDPPTVKALIADKTKDGAISCFEFWLNRYQSLIGSIFATTAAAIAAYAAWKAATSQIDKASDAVRAANMQLAEMKAQTSLVSAQSAGARASELRLMLNATEDAIKLYDQLTEARAEYARIAFDLERKLDALNAVYRENAALLTEHHANDVSRDAWQFRKKITEIADYAKALSENIRKFAWLDEERADYAQFVRHIERIIGSCRALSVIEENFRQSLKGSRPYFGLINPFITRLRFLRIDESIIHLVKYSGAIEAQKASLQEVLAATMRELISPEDRHTYGRRPLAANRSMSQQDWAQSQSSAADGKNRQPLA